MAITSQPTNPFNNTSPVLFSTANYVEPFALATALQTRNSVPQEVLDQVQSDINDIAKDSWLGFIDLFQMNIAFETDFVQFLETETRDFVIDDDGAVTRATNVFTIVPANIEGYETGEDYFFFRVDDAVMVVDSLGVEEHGVITAVDKDNDQFTAVCRNGANWSVATTNLSIDVTGSDHDKESCGPEGLLELRKKKSSIIKLMTIKDAMKTGGGKRYGFCLDAADGEYAWYDENTIKLQKRLNKKVAKSLMVEIESADGSAAHTAGKYGTKGLFQKLEEEGLVHTGYITTETELEAIASYWDSLGFAGDKEFVAHVDNTQYRYFEKIAGAMASSLNVELSVVLGNTPDNMMKLGFKSLVIGGYTVHFSKWGLTDGNSPLGKNRIIDAMPKGVIVPMGTVPTKINGVERMVPYIFKAYQNLPLIQSGMVRTFFSGAGANIDQKGSDCEYLKITKSTTVGIGVSVPEALTLIL